MGKYQGAAKKGVPSQCGEWELVPRAEHAAASEQGELREGEKGKRSPGGEAVQDPDRLFHSERGSHPWNLDAPRVALQYMHAPIVLCCCTALLSQGSAGAQYHTSVSAR